MNASGGVVNIITREPGDSWTGEVNAALGDYKTRKAKASVSGPLVKDRLSIGISGLYENQGEGYFSTGTSNPDTVDAAAGRARVKWTPTPTLSVLFSASAEHQDNGPRNWIPKDDAPYDIPDFNVDDEHNDIDIDIQSLKIKYKTPWVRVTSVSARESNRLDTRYALDLTGAGLMATQYSESGTNYTQEIRLSAPDDKAPFQWLVGGFYFIGDNTFDLKGLYDAYLYGYTPAPGLMTVEDPYYTLMATRTWAGFCQMDYTFRDKLTLTGGLRYDRDEKEMDYTHTGVAQYQTSEAWEAWSPKLSLNYRINPAFMTYVSVSKGFKAGGFAPVHMDSAEQAEFDPDTSGRTSTSVFSSTTSLTKPIGPIFSAMPWIPPGRLVRWVSPGP
jgi:iron complex outermembrane receptor protein